MATVNPAIPENISSIDSDIDSDINGIDKLQKNLDSMVEEVTQVEETEEEDEEEESVTITDVLEALKTFASQSLKTSTLLPLELLPEDYRMVIEPTVCLLESLIGIPHQKFFIKAVVNKNGFQSLRFPDLALYNGKISFIWHGNIFDVDDFFSKTLKAKGAKPLSFEIDDNRVYLRFNHPQDSSTRAFRFSVYTREFKTTDNTRIDPVALEQYSYLKKALVEYTFDTSYLPDGHHPVSKWVKKGNFYVATLVQGRDYYIGEFLVKNLQLSADRGSQPVLIVDGVNDKGYKNIYVEGFPRSISLAELVETLAAREGYTISDKTVFPEPIKVPVIGITPTEATENYPASFVLSTLIDGKTVNFQPNTSIKKAYANGMFKLNNFGGVYMLIYSTGTYVRKSKDAQNNPVENTYLTVNVNWEIPSTASRLSSSFDKMRAALM